MQTKLEEVAQAIKEAMEPWRLFRGIPIEKPSYLTYDGDVDFLTAALRALQAYSPEVGRLAIEEFGQKQNEEIIRIIEENRE